jgi:hypothetical protein
VLVSSLPVTQALVLVSASACFNGKVDIPDSGQWGEGSKQQKFDLPAWAASVNALIDIYMCLHIGPRSHELSGKGVSSHGAVGLQALYGPHL